MPLAYRYPSRVVAANYIRSALGLAASLGPLALLGPASWLSAVLLIAAALFLAYLARAVIRHSMRLELDADGIRMSALIPAAVRWDDLESIQLDYYSTRMDRSCGWMELVLRGKGRALRIESSLSGFESIVLLAARAALARNRELDERSLVHLAVLGIEPGTVRSGSLFTGSAPHA